MMSSAIIVILQNRTLSRNGVKAIAHTGSFRKSIIINRSLNRTLAFSSSTTTTTNAVAGISNTTDLSSRSNLVYQSIHLSNNGNKTTTYLFGTVIGISSALALVGLYSKHQKDQNLIQNVTTTQINNNANISQQQRLTATANDTTSLLIHKDDYKHQVVELLEQYQQEPQQPLVYHSRSTRLLSTSPVETVDEEFVDEYENLPETDEPTGCFLCLTYRQGPCRNVFRKFYHCSFVKGENTEKCLPYFSKFSDCSESYENLYELVQLGLYQGYVDSIEEDIKEIERRCWLSNSSSSSTGTTNPTIHIDWGDWPNFVSKEGLNYTQINNNADSTLPLWKRFPEGVDPILLSGIVSIPCTIDEKNTNKKQQTNDFKLKEVWVTDQDGMLLGYSRNKQFFAATTTVDTDDDDDKNEVESDNVKNEEESDDDSIIVESDDSNQCTCDFQIIPGLTKQVTVHGRYFKNSSVALQTKEEEPVSEPQVIIYSSKPYCTEKAATSTQ